MQPAAICSQYFGGWDEGVGGRVRTPVDFISSQNPWIGNQRLSYIGQRTHLKSITWPIHLDRSIWEEPITTDFTHIVPRLLSTMRFVISNTIGVNSTHQSRCQSSFGSRSGCHSICWNISLSVNIILIFVGCSPCRGEQALYFRRHVQHYQTEVSVTRFLYSIGPSRVTALSPS